METLSKFLDTQGGRALLEQVRLLIRDLGDQLLAGRLSPEALKSYADVIDKRR